MDEKRAPLPVFVYGTLRPGQKNYPRFLAGRTVRERPATVRGRLFLYVDPEEGRYPFLVPGEGVVQGDLIEIAEKEWPRTIAGLDALEDYHPASDTGLYLRRRAEAATSEGERVEAWVYYWNGPGEGCLEITGGDFAKWLARDKGEGR